MPVIPRFYVFVFDFMGLGLTMLREIVDHALKFMGPGSGVTKIKWRKWMAMDRVKWQPAACFRRI